MSQNRLVWVLFENLLQNGGGGVQGSHRGQEMSVKTKSAECWMLEAPGPFWSFSSFLPPLSCRLFSL